MSEGAAILIEFGVSITNEDARLRVVVETTGVPGRSIGGGGSEAFVFTQASPATTWTINHNLGFRPAVALFDTGGNEFDGAVNHPSVNQTIVSLAVATAGSARLQ